MNKTICHILAAFICDKEKRHNFREKHKNISIKELYNRLEFLEKENSNILLDIKKTQKFLSYHNIEKILSLKDKYKDQKCFIIGGSPSLKQLDLSKLNNSEYKVFTVNKGYKLRELGLLHSDFHCIIDNSCYQEVIDELSNDFFSLLFILSEIDFINYDKDVIFFDRIFYENKINMTNCYQDNLLWPLFDCATVIGTALQIATYMGFKDIYFIGVDLDFNQNIGYVYKSTKDEQDRQLTISKTTNHIMLDGLTYATKYLKAKNINLYNASPSGILDCMPRVKYDELFNK